MSECACQVTVLRERGRDVRLVELMGVIVRSLAVPPAHGERLRLLLDGVREALDGTWALMVREHGTGVRVAEEAVHPAAAVRSCVPVRKRARQAFTSSPTACDPLPPSMSGRCRLILSAHAHPDGGGEGLVVVRAAERAPFHPTDHALLARIHEHIQPLYVPRPWGPVTTLTLRQKDVLHMLEKGFSEPEIARSLSISPHTVHSHAKTIYAALGIHNRTRLVALANSRGSGIGDP